MPDGPKLSSIDIDDGLDLKSPPTPPLLDRSISRLTEDDFRNSECKELVLGDDWFIVPTEFYKNTKENASRNPHDPRQREIHIQPLDCRPILEINANREWYLNRNIQENVDFVQVSKELFEKLEHFYGVADKNRDIIMRKVVNIGKYKKELNMHEFQKKNEIFFKNSDPIFLKYFFQ